MRLRTARYAATNDAIGLPSVGPADIARKLAGAMPRVIITASRSGPRRALGGKEPGGAETLKR